MKTARKPGAWTFFRHWLKNPLRTAAALQRDILEAAFECLRPGGMLVQFTYGPVAPVADVVAREMGLTVRRGDFVLRNMPPARVYVYGR